MLWQQLSEPVVELGWSFYGPVLLFLGMIALGVPIWAAIGTAATAMLVISQVLPLSLLGNLSSKALTILL